MISRIISEKRIALHFKAVRVASLYRRCRSYVPQLIADIIRATESDEALAKYNHNHDPDNGQFTTGQGAGVSAGESDASSAKPAKDLKASKEGVNFIAQHERFRPQMYRDDAGYWTIGYGHKLLPGESYPNGITRDAAQELLADDIKIAETAVQNEVKVNLTQAQFDALTSFTYNEGVGHFGTSTLLKLLNQGDFQGAADQFPLWNKVTQDGKVIIDPGLVNRRDAERRLFLQGIYK